MSSFSITEAQLVAGYLESVLYGFHTVAFGFGLRRLIWGSRTRIDVKEGAWSTMNRLLVAAGILLWILATIHIILFLYDSIQAFVFYQGPGGPAAAITTRAWRGHVRSMIFLLEAVIGDLVMIYRCFIVYGRSWRIIALSLVLLLAELGCGLASFIIQVTAPPRINLTQVGKILQSVTLGTWAITCALTMLNTLLIILRIWLVERDSREYITPSAKRDNTLMYAIRIVMESGLLYAAVMLILLIVYSAGSNGAYPLTDSVPQVIGIAFNLIIVRSSQRSDDTYATTGTSMAFTVPMSRHISSSHEERTSATVTSGTQDDFGFRVPRTDWDNRGDNGKIELHPIGSSEH